MWDAFICHASEDKDAFVRPLAIALVQKGLKVWYDEFALNIGDSLTQSINKGVSTSRFGIVVLSPSFFGRGWPERELGALTARELDEKVILPVWHNVTLGDVRRQSPVLADKLAAKSSDGVNAVCDQILAVIHPVAPVHAEQGPLIRPEITPYIFSSLAAYLRRLNADFDWRPYIGTIYSSHRQLFLGTIEQLSEAVEDRATQATLEGLYSRLLNRQPDPLGKVIYAPWLFLLVEQGVRSVESSIMSSPEYRNLRKRNRAGIESPPQNFVEDPMTQGPNLPAGWDGDAWVDRNQTEYFLRAWNKQSGRTAVGRGGTYVAARQSLLQDVHHGDSQAVIAAR